VGFESIGNYRRGHQPETAPENIDLSPHYPASYNLDNIITVAATTRRDELYALSNFGATNVDLAAPGDEIYSTPFSIRHGLLIRRFSPGDTSMAAAYVSGAAALLRAAHPAETPPHRSSGDSLTATDPLPGLAGKVRFWRAAQLAVKHWALLVSAPVLRASFTCPCSCRARIHRRRSRRLRHSLLLPASAIVLRIAGDPVDLRGRGQHQPYGMVSAVSMIGSDLTAVWRSRSAFVPNHLAILPCAARPVSELHPR
jgi:hypothetical protein